MSMASYYARSTNMNMNIIYYNIPFTHYKFSAGVWHMMFHIIYIMITMHV